MGPAEWLGAASLTVALVALAVAGIAAANQLASHKRPLPSVDFFSVERLGKAARPPIQPIMLDTIVSALIIKITNRGHEPMLNPRVFDSTPGYVVYEKSNREHSMPYEMDRGKTVEMVTSYSLANDYDRVISVVWEEAALFGRAPKTMGVRFHVPARKDFAWDVTPQQQWNRIGPFGKMGWQRPGRPWSMWLPAWGTPTDPGADNVWSNTHEHINLSVYEEERILTKSFAFEDMVGKTRIEKRDLTQFRERGLQLPKEKRP